MVLITGGTSGLGEATMEAFVAEVVRVVICSRNAEKGSRMVGALGASTRFVKADVLREAEIMAAIDVTVDAFGRLDCLFNNAGGPTRGGVDTMTAEDFTQAMDLLLNSVIFGIRYAAPVMTAQGRGAIINNTNVAAHRTHLGDYLYSIAKAGVSHATRLAGVDLGRHGISVNAISPGAIATPIFFGGSAEASGLAPGQADAKMVKLTSNLAKAPRYRDPYRLATSLRRRCSSLLTRELMSTATI